MSKQRTFYITTTLPYVNASPHIGFAAEIIKADVIARHQTLLGKDVFFNFGTDEHGLKIYRKATEAGKTPKEYCDEYAAQFEKLKQALNVSYNNFIRTTDEHHIKAAQAFWSICKQNGHIYKKNYQVKYCVGCELEKTDSELVDGRCSFHPNQEIELIDEENYFFRFSSFAEDLLKLYQSKPDFVTPSHRLAEIRNFVQSGLEDFSISRLKEKMPWGVPVPDDSDHVMYVWFDALVNYIAAIGWPDDMAKFKKYWPILQVAGKDNLRQQSAMWQAMLKSVGLPYSDKILIFGFITSNGQKMSKSLGNVVNPFDMVEKYGTDALRYYLLSGIPTYEDGDFTTEKFEVKYNADLANGIGNLVSRSVTLALKLKEAGLELEPTKKSVSTIWRKYMLAMEGYEIDRALEVVKEDIIGYLDAYITKNKPWEMIKNKDTKAGQVVYNMLEHIRHMSLMLWPFLPQTAENILLSLGLNIDEIKTVGLKKNQKWGILNKDSVITKCETLFPRL